MKTLAEFHFDASLAERYKADILYAECELAKLAHSGKVLGIGENVALEMTSLSARLKAASEGSRELSDEVLLALDVTEWGLPHKPDPTRNLHDITDMASAQGYAWRVQSNGLAAVCTLGIDLGDYSKAATPPLALCIALLHAKEQEDG